jgi:hypothetical protein
MSEAPAASSPPFGQPRRESRKSRLLRTFWLHGFLPSVLLVVLGFVSIFSVSY